MIELIYKYDSSKIIVLRMNILQYYLSLSIKTIQFSRQDGLLHALIILDAILSPGDVTSRRSMRSYSASSPTVSSVSGCLSSSGCKNEHVNSDGEANNAAIFATYNKTIAVWAGY